MNFVVVVAKYKENVDWITNSDLPHIVYNKDKDNNNPTFISLPNIGREAHTYLYYIVNNYHNLPKYVFFSEGNCRSNRIKGENETLDSLYKIIKTYKGYPRLLPMGIEVTEQVDCIGEQYDINFNVLKVYYDLFEVYKDTYTFYQGGQLIVPRERIKFHTLKFYKHLIENISDKKDNGICAWTLERLWPYIYDGKTKSKYE